MVDENDSIAVVQDDAAEPPVTAPEVKKQRAKRRSPAELAAVAAAKSQKANGKKKSVPAESSKPTIASKAPSTKVTTRGSAKAEVSAPAAAPSLAVDEFADLIQLEEENKSLRKALSEKLRAENADLRKRLGQK